MSISLSKVILRLPAVLSCEILSAWLSVPGLVRLDSAYCDHMDRKKFHSLYEQMELVASLCNNSRQNICWFIERRIRLRDFSVDMELPTNLVVGYFKDFGRSIESILLLDGTNCEIVESIKVYCPSLGELCVAGEVGLALGLLNTLRCVHRLEVYFPRFAEDNKLPTSELHELPALRKLKIVWEYSQIENIISLVDKCTRLTHFSPHCGDSIPSQKVFSLFSNLSNLTALDVSALDIDDVALTKIALKCPLLEHLDLHGCCNITDAGIYAVATSLKLKSISVPCDYELTDMSLRHLHHCCDTLTALYIAHWVGYTSTVIKLSRSAVDRLVSSTRNPCRCIWETDLMKHKGSLENCANTTVLHVSTSLTDALLFDIAQHCKYLEYLDIAAETEGANAKITSAGLNAVIIHCPVLKHICVHTKMNRAPYADVMALHSKLFTGISVPVYDVMTM